MSTSLPPTDDAAGREPRARRMRHLAGFVGIASIVVAADQITKALVRQRLALGETWPEGWSLIRLTHVENTGAAFGILQGAGDLLVVVTLIAIGAITFFLLTLPGHGRLYHLALSIVLGGAIGNLIDRLRLGAVTDFIDPTHYPAFNLADSSIVVGVIALFLLSWFEPRPDREEPATATTTARQPE